MKEFLDHFDHPDVLKTKMEDYSPYHIFRKLIKHFEPNLSFNDRVLAFLHFQKYELCLRCAKTGELKSAEVVLIQIQNLDQKLPSAICDGMKSLYHAMYAYYVYACGKYDEAIDNLQKAIACSIRQGREYPLMLATIQEQWLNIVRVYFKQRDVATALREAHGLFEFSLYGDYGDVIVERGFLTLDYDAHASMLYHVFNNIFAKVFLLYPGDPQATVRVLGRLILPMAAKDQAKALHRPISNVIIQLDHFYGNRKQEFIQGLAADFESLQKVPSMLQRLAITCYLETLIDLDSDISAHCNYKTFERICEGMEIDIETFVQTSS